MGTRISTARGAAVGAAALLAVATFVPATASAAGSQNGSGFNQPGNDPLRDQSPSWGRMTPSVSATSP
jgi:hypothetical protein